MSSRSAVLGPSTSLPGARPSCAARSPAQIGSATHRPDIGPGVASTADCSGTNAQTRRDGFSFVAFLFPTLWLLFHRLWLHALAAFILQGIGGELMRRDGPWPAGLAILFGVSVLTALEGRHLNARRLANRGWTDEGVLVAGRRDEAEDLYFADLPDEPVAAAAAAAGRDCRSL